MARYGVRVFPYELLADSILDGYDNEEAGLKFVEETDWTVDHKYQHRAIIFEFEGKLYRVNESRSGSPFSEYHYIDAEYWRSSGKVETELVERVEIVTYEYRRVKEEE